MKSQFRRPTFLQTAISIALCSLVFLSVRARAAESPSVLLQKAIFAEETEGNLDAAINIYEGIVKELWTISGENGEMKKTELVMPGVAIIGTHGETQIFFENISPRSVKSGSWRIFYPRSRRPSRKRAL